MSSVGKDVKDIMLPLIGGSVVPISRQMIENASVALLRIHGCLLR